MKILIVDDNAAIQDILSEILNGDGYETMAASTLEDAADMVTSFKPDAVLLDTAVDDRNGLELMDMMLARSHQLSNVILLSSPGDQIPKDNISIVGAIQKPFKSTEVLEKLHSLFNTESVKERPKRSFFKSLFGKKAEAKEEKVPGLTFGSSYLFVENDGGHAYSAALFFLKEGCDLMVITSGKIKAAIERMDDDNVRVVALSGKEGPDYVDPEMIGTLMGTMADFIGETERPTIMIDDLDILIERNGLNSVLTMMHQVINNDYGKKLTLIASTVSDNMTEKDRELLLHSMEIRIFE